MTAPQLRPEVKAKWVEALRSGEYQQTTSVLRDDEGFCCLGVLCEVAVKAGVIPPARYTDQFGGEYLYGAAGHEMTAALPVAVQDWAFEEPFASAADPMLGDQYQASEWNDSREASFDEIANLVERHL